MRRFTAILSTFILLTSCASWSAGKSFDAGRAGAKTLEIAAQATCRQESLLTSEQAIACHDFEMAAKELKASIDDFEESWGKIAPMLGIDKPEAAKVAKRE